jgi:hypothetical protein
MNIRKAILLVTFFVTSFISAHAQLQLTAFSDSATTPPACQEAVSAFIHLSVQYQRPTQWHFYVVCDEKSWTKLLKKQGIDDTRYQVYGSTFLGSHITYLRGYKLVHTDAADPTPDRIVAHELAHIALQSTDEALVDSTAKTWVTKIGRPWGGPEDVTTTEEARSQQVASR